MNTTELQGFFVPKRYFLAAGSGDACNSLVAFDQALIQAGVSDVNLIKLSSIVPPGSQRIEPAPLAPGSFIGVAFAWLTSSQSGQHIASAVAIAHPANLARASLVMEHSAAASREEVERRVVQMALDGMKSRGLEVARVESISVEHVVQVVGATFAGVVEV